MLAVLAPRSLLRPAMLASRFALPAWLRAGLAWIVWCLQEMTAYFVSLGWDQLDTALMYASGDSEKFIGGFDQKLLAKVCAPSLVCFRALPFR